MISEPVTSKPRRKVTTSQQILIGLFGGIVTGLFLGERLAFLEWASKAFVDLLQITVLPFIVGSLIVGIGEKTGKDARQLAIYGGLVLVVTWILTLGLVFATPLVLPSDKGGVFFSALPVSETTIDWLDLYIPSNPFRSLANNTVPAVVIFSILVGAAMINMPGKERILQPLKAFNDALARVGIFMVKISPIGIFAIAGFAAGTMRIDEFRRMEAFFLIYIGLSILLSFWLIPGIISAVTNIPYRRIVALSMDAFITAFVTSSVFVVLPIIAARSKELLRDAHISEETTSKSADVLIPASFNFPHSAKILSLCFVLFAGWFAGTPVSTSMYPVIGSVGILSFFGSLNTAIPFMLNLLRMPSDLFQMFLVSSVLNSRFGSGAAVMHTFAIAILGTYLMERGLRFQIARFLRFLVITVIVLTGFLVGGRILLDRTLPDPKDSSAILDQLKLSGAWGHLAKVREFKETPAPPVQTPVRGERLNEIMKRKVIRVGYFDDALPWCFRNSHGELVGSDIDMAHTLAVQLGVDLELIPAHREKFDQELNSGICDILMTGVRATPLRAVGVQFSKPYAEESASFLVPDPLRDSFSSVQNIQKLKAPKIAVLNIFSWVDRLRITFPNAQITTINSVNEFINAKPGRFDALYGGWERAAAWSLLRPQFTPVIPDPGMGSFPLAYAVPKYENDLLSFVNTWIDGRIASGMIQQKIDYWVRGQGVNDHREPRWCIATNVFGFWK